MDYESPPAIEQYTLPEFMKEAEMLVKKLKKYTPEKIAGMMNLSTKLAHLNFERYQEWTPEFTPSNARQAILAFKGDVYTGMNAATFTPDAFDFSQKHLRILSGLHGVLRPLDLIRPYRLEMGTRFAITPQKNNLYRYWGTKIAGSLNRAMAEQGDGVLVNLASGEYYKATDPKALKADRIVNMHFKDYKNGVYKTIFLWVKQARGMMASWAIRNRIEKADDLKGFDQAGYYYSPNDSTENNWVFLRDKPAGSSVS